MRNALKLLLGYCHFRFKERYESLICFSYRGKRLMHTVRIIIIIGVVVGYPLGYNTLHKLLLPPSLFSRPHKYISATNVEAIKLVLLARSRVSTV